MHILYNNALQANAAMLSPANRSFRFGDGLFESMRRVKGRIPLLPLHIDRLVAGLRVLGIERHSAFWPDALEAAATRLAALNGCGTGGRLRLSVWRRGTAPGYAPETAEAEWLLECEPMPHPDAFVMNETGLRLATYPHMRKPLNALASLKTANGLLYVLAAQFAKQHGHHEALLLNEAGHLCEGASNNIFLVMPDRRLVTPALSEGCLPGVMRQTVLALAQADGLVIEERPVALPELAAAAEVVCTNAVAGLQWAVAWERTRYFKKWSAKATHMLNASLAE